MIDRCLLFFFVREGDLDPDPDPDLGPRRSHSPRRRALSPALSLNLFRAAFHHKSKRQTALPAPRSTARRPSRS